MQFSTQPQVLMITSGANQTSPGSINDPRPEKSRTCSCKFHDDFNRPLHVLMIITIYSCLQQPMPIVIIDQVCRFKSVPWLLYSSINQVFFDAAPTGAVRNASRFNHHPCGTVQSRQQLLATVGCGGENKPVLVATFLAKNGGEGCHIVNVSLTRWVVTVPLA